ncbi:Stress response protein nst1, partial [Fusarium oxysporum]
MPANNQRPAAQTPVSPRNTAKYTNKDGSKFITCPTTEASNPDNDPAPTVNRKKQKRRQKAALNAAQQAANGHTNNAASGGART